jgi:hypothetical protein
MTMFFDVCKGEAKHSTGERGVRQDNDVIRMKCKKSVVDKHGLFSSFREKNQDLY